MSDEEDPWAEALSEQADSEAVPENDWLTNN